ncbi:MAG: hypothetical protein KKD44_16125 [Proteobacteria bacterium]|nr:hypothetical protein [Pseudomonadota bacterium]
MAMTISMQHYGRGVGKVPMPRALARDPRKEWPVTPAFIIFILAVTLILSLKLTMSNKKLFKVTQTIIILPQTKPAPEPTVPKKIPLIKVLKDAVKKTVEPKRMELKKIIPQKIEPKKPLEKRIEPKKIEPLKPLDTKIQPKKIIREDIKPKALIPKQLEIQRIETKKIEPAKPLPKSISEKPTVLKKIDLPQETAPKITPKMVSAPSSFTPMQEIKRNSAAIPVPSDSIARPQANSVPISQGPPPELTQWESYKPPVATDSSLSAPLAHAPKMPSPAQPPVRHFTPAFEGLALEDLVIIKSSTLGNSERVKNLKRAIVKKAQNMNPELSPYTYTVKNYTCTLVIEGGAQGKIIIDFTPADAPFEVVSALERILPR